MSLRRRALMNDDKVRYLYKNGIEIVPFTFTKFFDPAPQYTRVVCTKESTTLRCTRVSNQAYTLTHGFYSPLIDLTKYSKCVAVFSVQAPTTDGGIHFGVCSNTEIVWSSAQGYVNNYAMIRAKQQTTVGPYRLEIDVSNINEERYIEIFFYCGGATEKPVIDCHEIWVEK